MKRTNVFLPEQQRAGLKWVAERSGGTPSEHLRRAIDEYLTRNGYAFPQPAPAKGNSQ